MDLAYFDEDFRVFSRAHSWYKHITTPNTFLFSVFFVANDPRPRWELYFEGETTHRYKRSPAIVAILRRYPVTMTPFVFTGAHGTSFHLIRRMWKGQPLKEWLTERGHSALADHLTNKDTLLFDQNPLVSAVFTEEYCRLLAISKAQAGLLVEDLKASGLWDEFLTVSKA